MSDTAARPVSDHGHDDIVLPFAVEPLDLRGRLVRLGPAVDRVLARHDYPAPVTHLLGEATALAVLLGSALDKSGARFQLQTKSDGAVSMLVVDFDAPDSFRAFARFDAERLAGISQFDSGALLGMGHLAFTIDQGGDMARYQGVVELKGAGAGGSRARIFSPIRTDPDARASRRRANRHQRRDELARRRVVGAIPARFARTASACRPFAGRRPVGGGDARIHGR